jgi:hypothetical protein
MDKYGGFRKSRNKLYMTDPNRQEEDIYFSRTVVELKTVLRVSKF